MRTGRAAILAAVMALAVCGGVTVAGATGSSVSHGQFHTFAAGAARGYAVTGHAQMVRRANGTTFVSIHVGGLTPGVTYGSHVHKLPCAQSDADGHYKFPAAVPGGASPTHDEIWPGPVTANGGGEANGNTTVGATAGPDARSVVVHDADGTKIACADLH